MTDPVPTFLDSIFSIQNAEIPAGDILARATARATALEPWLKAFTYLPASYRGA